MKWPEAESFSKAWRKMAFVQIAFCFCLALSLQSQENPIQRAEQLRMEFEEMKFGYGYGSGPDGKLPKILTPEEILKNALEILQDHLGKSHPKSLEMQARLIEYTHQDRWSNKDFPWETWQEIRTHVLNGLLANPLSLENKVLLLTAMERLTRTAGLDSSSWQRQELEARSDHHPSALRAFQIITSHLGEHEHPCARHALQMLLNMRSLDMSLHLWDTSLSSYELQKFQHFDAITTWNIKTSELNTFINSCENFSTKLESQINGWKYAEPLLSILTIEEPDAAFEIIQKRVPLQHRSPWFQSLIPNASHQLIQKIFDANKDPALSPRLKNLLIAQHQKDIELGLNKPANAKAMLELLRGPLGEAEIEPKKYHEWMIQGFLEIQDLTAARGEFQKWLTLTKAELENDNYFIDFELHHWLDTLLRQGCPIEARWYFNQAGTLLSSPNHRLLKARIALALGEIQSDTQAIKEFSVIRQKAMRDNKFRNDKAWYEWAAFALDSRRLGFNQTATRAARFLSQSIEAAIPNLKPLKINPWWMAEETQTLGALIEPIELPWHLARRLESSQAPQNKVDRCDLAAHLPAPPKTTNAFLSLGESGSVQKETIQAIKRWKPGSLSQYQAAYSIRMAFEPSHQLSLEETSIFKLFEKLKFTDPRLPKTLQAAQESMDLAKRYRQQCKTLECIQQARIALQNMKSTPIRLHPDQLREGSDAWRLMAEEILEKDPEGLLLDDYLGFLKWEKTLPKRGGYSTEDRSPELIEAVQRRRQAIESQL